MFRTHIRLHERGLWFRRGDFRRLLWPGTYWTARLSFRDHFEVVDATETKLEHPLLEVLVRQPALREALEVVDLKDGDRALVWRDERLFAVLGPGLHAFWKAPATVRVESFAVEAFRFQHPRMAQVLGHPAAKLHLEVVKVEPGEEVLLLRDGLYLESLKQGLHAFWQGTGELRFKKVDRRERMIDVAGQEILTSDKVSVRVNLVVIFQVEDPIRAVTTAVDAEQALYREAQLALRAVIGTRTLDALLADKEAAGAELKEAIAGRARELGLSVRGVGLRDFILPGEMRELLNQVVAATKEAEANLIRRREETAAARSQANTARLLAENPQLQRLRELEVLRDVLAGAKTTFVFGAGDIAGQVRDLVTSPRNDSG